MCNFTQLEHMKINDYYELTFSFNQEQVDLFAKITGDLNPIHINKDYASQNKFGRCIMHGFLSGSIFSRIIGMYFPGNGAIYLSQSMKFIKPMYVDNEYIAKVTVVESYDDKNRYNLKTSIYDNSSAELTIDGDAVVYYKLS